jgi:hypothetical protein
LRSTSGISEERLKFKVPDKPPSLGANHEDPASKGRGTSGKEPLSPLLLESVPTSGVSGVKPITGCPDVPEDAAPLVLLVPLEDVPLEDPDEPSANGTRVVGPPLPPLSSAPPPPQAATHAIHAKSGVLAKTRRMSLRTYHGEWW